MLPFWINLLTASVFTGAIVWGLAWLLSRAAPWLRFKGAFADLVQNTAGASARRVLRDKERDLLLLGCAALSAITACLVLCIYLVPRLTGVWMWVLFAPACLLFIAWWVFLVRDLRRWLERRFAARAQAAFAGALARLNLQGHRVFHDVRLGDITLDHVVMGPKGLFAIRLVARPPKRGAETVVRINGRSIEFQDGFALLDAIAMAERGARALSDMQVKGLSHRLHVLPVVAVPGWEIAPAQGQAGETFLANEKTAMLLLRASKPADYLMDTDLGPLQEYLTRVTVDPGL
ncbi:MAG TPA: nuclease-related domain-containing protein [Gammaproteobacteria bacterium]|nr:nuclease-related domain-containing protein [Gammaproteobacteria bacterium]